MRRNIYLFLSLFLMIIMLAVGCENQVNPQEETNLEDTIRQTVASKSKNYNFLKDEHFMENIDKFIDKIKAKNSNSNISYTVGLLDEDNIPEIAVFIGKDPTKSEDTGRLEIYGFKDFKYVLLDSEDMNYDVSNYQMEIGKISEDQRGLFLNNKARANSGVTYGYILEEDKLKSILDNEKICLISISTDNEIKDIDGDGILNFSISTIDPETEASDVENADKMTIWYRWNESDTGKVIKVERNDLSKAPSNKTAYRKISQSLERDFSKSLDLLQSNKDLLSKYDTTKLLKEYIDQLNSKSYDKSLEIGKLFQEHQEGQSLDYLFLKYDLDTEKINQVGFLSSSRAFKDEPRLKNHLVKNLDLGYKLNLREGLYYYSTDYDRLLDLFKDYTTREYEDYLKILSLNSQSTYLPNGDLAISDENLVDRILLVESFKMVYPFSDLFKEISYAYRVYVSSYLYGDSKNPKFDPESGKIKDKALEEFNTRIEKYPYTTFAGILRDFLDAVKDNNNKINDNIRERLNKRLE